MSGARPLSAQEALRTAASRGTAAGLTAVAAALAVALALRLTWALLVDPPVSFVNDTGQYDTFARSIAAGRGYVGLSGEPTAFWPVGYPAVLGGLYWLLGHSILAGKLLNVLLSTATVGLLYLFTRRWLGREQAVLAAAILALMPGPVTFTSLLLSETLFTALFVGSLVVLAWRGPGGRPARWQGPAFGLVTAAAVYVRTQALLLPAVAALWLVLAGRPWREALRFGAVSLAVVLVLNLPWAVRNTVRMGEPTLLSTNLGINLWVGHHEGASGGLDFLHQVSYVQQFEHLPPQEAELAVNRQGTRDAVRFALANPVEEIRLTVRKFVRLYGDDADGLRWNEYYGDRPIFHGAWRWVAYGTVDAYYWAVGALAVLGLVAGLRRELRRFAPLALVLIYWTAAHVVFFTEPRFHVPVLPLFAVLAAYAVTPVALGWWKGRRARGRPAGEAA